MTKDKDEPPKGPKKTGKFELTGEDRHLWDFVTRSIRPLDHGKRARLVPDPKPAKKTIVQDAPRERSRLTDWIPSFGMKETITPEPKLTGGIDRRTAEKLRRGELPIEGRLDLHGLHQGEAQDRLTRFILDAHNADRRCLLVITGKGNKFNPEQEAGVLRRLFPIWIGLTPLAPIILMHTPAQPRDGGSGAFYILLRRRR